MLRKRAQIFPVVTLVVGAALGVSVSFHVVRANEGASVALPSACVRALDEMQTRMDAFIETSDVITEVALVVIRLSNYSAGMSPEELDPILNDLGVVNDRLDGEAAKMDGNSYWTASRDCRRVA